MFRMSPENVDGGVVLLSENIQPQCDTGCKLCVDFAVGVHNWLLASQVPYVIIDFQDDKDVCRVFVEELIHLRKRLGIPFCFVGVMSRTRKIFEEYALTQDFYLAPEEAVRTLKSKYLGLIESVDHTQVRYADKINVSKARLQQRLGVDTDIIHQPTEVSL